MTASALLVIDFQQAFDDVAYWGQRNNPRCEENVVALVAAWRSRRLPVVVVRHDSVEEGSPLRPSEPGNALKPELEGDPDLLVTKSVHSSFHGVPNLDGWLRERGIDHVVVCGVATDHCCETTARVACDLGYRVTIPIDATHTFDRQGPDGEVIGADEIAQRTAASLNGEFATITETAALLAEDPVSA
jgi:nicotinamidase-related amidase